MSKNGNPKILLKIPSFSGVSKHNALISIFKSEKTMTLNFHIFCGLLGVFLCQHIYIHKC
jgi:hypothetical protein